MQSSRRIGCSLREAHLQVAMQLFFHVWESVQQIRPFSWYAFVRHIALEDFPIIANSSNSMTKHVAAIGYKEVLVLEW